MDSGTAVLGANTTIGKREERLFFSSYAIALTIVIFAGFAPSFYLRGIVAPYHRLAPLRPEVIFHGMLAGAFILLYPLQTWLIATGRRAWHIRVGNWGFVLGLLMLPLGYFVAASFYRVLANLPPNLGIRPALVVTFPLLDLVALAILLAVAWRKRFDVQAHKRLMILIACGLADPAISRLPLGGEGLLAALTAGTVLPLWLWDLARNRRIHWATLFGSGLLFVKLLSRPLVAPTDGWATLVGALPGFGAP
jgi:hypothetical protein